MIIISQRNTKLTQDEFKERMSKINPNIIFLSEYKSRKQRILCECTICGNQWNPMAGKLLDKRGCPKCAIKKRPQSCPQTQESFLEKFEKGKDENVILLEPYKNSSTKILCECKECGNRWKTIPTSLIAGHGCPKCGYNKIRKKTSKSHEQFIKEFEQFGNPNIEILGTYISCSFKLQVRCKECGRVWDMSPIKLLYGHQGCVDCYRKHNIGENNPSWNPNKTDEDRLKGRKYKEYTEFIKQALKKDKYTCQITGENSSSLNVHHLNGYSWDIENRLNLDNVITITEDIHREFHKMFGYNGAKKEDFVEFVKILYNQNRINSEKYNELINRLK